MNKNQLYKASKKQIVKVVKNSNKKLIKSAENRAKTTKKKTKIYVKNRHQMQGISCSDFMQC